MSVVPPIAILIDDGLNGQLFVTGLNGAIYTGERTPTGNGAWTVIPGKTNHGPAVSQIPLT